MEPGKQYAPDQNVVERWGLNFLRGAVDREDSHIHRWSDAELHTIQEIERRTVLLAAVAGAVSGTLIGTTEIFLSGRLLPGGESTNFWESLTYWSAFMGVALLVSAAEILYLYRTVLRMVARTCSIAGLALTDDEIEQVMSRGLSRAALEIPNPRTPVYGIDPYMRTARWKLIGYTLLYRVKIGATSFILRILLRRLLARATLRSFIPLIAIPVYAAWNGIITYWVMREARIRSAGPIAVEDLGERIRVGRHHLDARSRRSIVEAVGESIIRTADTHPNFVLLLTRLFRDLEVSPASIRIDWNAARHRLKDMDPREQDALLTTLTGAAVLDGRVRRTERELLADAHAACGRPFRADALAHLRRDFLNGQGIGDGRLEQVGSRSARESRSPAHGPR